MSNKAGIKVEFTYDTWCCTVPSKAVSKTEHASILRKNIINTMRDGRFDYYDRELPVSVHAPYMNIDTVRQGCKIDVDFNAKKIKTNRINEGKETEISIDSKIKVTMTWRARNNSGFMIG